MNDIALYFEIRGTATDEDGNRSCAGATLILGKTDKIIKYERLTKNLDVEVLLQYLGMSDLFDAQDVRVISPEEYKSKYGKNEEDENRN